MQSVKIIVDELQVLGKNMDAEEITDAVLNGLDSTTYKTIIDVVHARDTPISFTELHEKLLNHELTLLQQSPFITNLHQPTTAFAAQKRPQNKPWKLPILFHQRTLSHLLLRFQKQVSSHQLAYTTKNHILRCPSQCHDIYTAICIV